MSEYEGTPVRCSCYRRTVLAIAGVSDTGELFLHIKAWKGQKIYAEVVVTQGIARIHCRDCGRWTTVRIRPSGYHHAVEELPESIPV